MDKFVADESVDFRIIKYLRESGFEIIPIIKENPGIDDDEVLKYATSIKAILITEDKDFGELTFRLRKRNHGIVLLRFGGVPISERNTMLLAILQKFEGKFTDKFSVITSDKIRIRNQS